MYQVYIQNGRGLTVWGVEIDTPGSHGPSVGRSTAGGIYNVLFENSTLNGYDSLGNLSASDTGIQIKSDVNTGGLTRRVIYADICMTNIKHLLIFNPHCSSGGTGVPTESDIVPNGVVSTRFRVRTATTAARARPSGKPHRVRERLHLQHQHRPGHPEGDSANDVNVTAVPGTGTVPVCDIPAFGPPPACLLPAGRRTSSARPRPTWCDQPGP